MIDFSKCCDPGIVLGEQYSGHLRRIIHNRVLSLKFFGIDPESCIPWIWSSEFDVVNEVIQENRPPSVNPFTSSIISPNYFLYQGIMNIWYGEAQGVTSFNEKSSYSLNMSYPLVGINESPFFTAKKKFKVPDSSQMYFTKINNDIRIKVNPFIVDALNLLPISIDKIDDFNFICSVDELNLIIYMLCFIGGTYDPDMTVRRYDRDSVFNTVMQSNDWCIDPENYLPSLKDNIERKAEERYNSLSDLDALCIVKEQYGHLLSEDYSINQFMNDTYPGQTFRDVAKLCFALEPVNEEGDVGVDEADSNI